jgi:hypothetical protein
MMQSLFLVLLLAAAAAPVETAFYSDNSQQDFAPGEKENVFVNDAGQVALAPNRTVLIEGVDYVWCVAVAPGGAVYAGTLPGGKVYRAAEGKSDVFFDTGQSGVFSLVILPDGSLVAGTGSEGKVFKISPDGQGTLLATLDAQYVFGLALGPAGVIYASTGGTAGRIYRIDGATADVLYQSPSAHLTALALAPDGTIYASSGDRGAIYKVAADGSATVIFSAAQRVVQDVAVGPDGSVYAATAAIAEEKPGAEEEVLKAIIGEIQSRRDATNNPAPAATPARRTYKVANSLYRILPNGQVQNAFTISGALILSILPQGNRVLCGTAGLPGVFVVDPVERRAARLFESKSEQVLDLAANPSGGFVAALGMPGQAVNFGGDLSRAGAFTSRVIEAKGLTRWGRFTWAGETPTGTVASWSLRSGNTPVVDATWVDWRDLDAASGSAEMALPPSRYAQYRVKLATASPDATPLVREVTLAGLPMNVPPAVHDISVGKEPPKPAPPQGAPPPADSADSKDAQPRPKPQDASAFSGVSPVSWKADDANGDKLVFTLEFRESSMQRFIKIAGDLSDARYNWDTTSVPDGSYFLRVTASDGPSNPAGTELSSSREEGPFIIDNTPPVLAPPKVTKTETGAVIDVDVSDASSALASASYSVDGGKWEALVPADGIFDSPSEKISVKVDKPDASIVVIRVLDRAGNSGAVIAAIK